MKIVYLTAGAAGMFCGSCMHDNTLAKAIANAGTDIELVPTYTPIRTDEHDVSVDQVFFGGINVYLQQKLPFLRFLPGFIDRFLDSPWLIRRVTRNASNVSMKVLGRLAVSMLKGLKGRQRKEVKRLCNWLQTHSRPDVVLFTNILIGGCIPAIKDRLGAKVVVTLQGDDIFLESLNETHRKQCLDEIKKLTPFVDRFVAHSSFYADFMSGYLSIPRKKIDVTPLGIDTSDFSMPQSTVMRPPTIGYLARLAPEKGLAPLVEGFIELKKRNLVPDVRLKIAGWMGDHQKEFVEQQFEKLRKAEMDSAVEYVGSIDRDQKLEFLHSIDLLSVPTIYQEPKGLFALEALAAGVPVILPRHGAFPEILAEAECGLLHEPGNLNDYISRLSEILNDRSRAIKMGENGFKYIHETRNSGRMAAAILEVLRGMDDSAPD